MDFTPARLIAAAEQVVRTRLRQRSPAAPVSTVSRGGASSEGEAVTQWFASMIGVGTEHLRDDDRLGDILRVQRSELPEDVRPLLEKFGLGDFVSVYGFEILDHVEDRTAKDRSIIARAPFVPLPRSEDEWMDRIMSMTVGELLTALAGDAPPTTRG